MQSTPFTALLKYKTQRYANRQIPIATHTISCLQKLYRIPPCSYQGGSIKLLFQYYSPTQET